MTRIYVIRHGETAWNADGNRYCGRTDLPLSKTGKAQAAKVAIALSRVPLEAIHVSPLLRARQTADAINEARALPVIVGPPLTEVDFGSWEGLTTAQLAARDPESRAAWIEDPTHVRAGRTGETGGDVSARVLDHLHAIARDHPAGAIAVVGHSSASRFAIAASLGAPLASYRRLVLDNASISVLEIEDGATRWLHINDTAHLRP